ncbi:MAG: hypothetical protein SVK44_05040 [Nitrospirota bacterium]|nr:hypothetical protein [Nitrospirota bacterium]
MRDWVRQVWLFFGHQANAQGMMVREVAPEHVHPIPDGSFVIKDSDYLLVMGRDEDIRRVKGT